MNTQPTELLTTDEKRAWLASIFRDQSGAFTAADKIKALKADTLLALTEENSNASPENGIKNTETAPKYDPCRKFRKGDIVTPKERNGRIPWGKDTKLKVVDDERMAGVSVRDEESGESHFICVLFLELVTPVEELEPYIVTYDDKFYHIHKHGEEASIAVYSEARHPHAKAAAVAECERLNAELRKEQE